MVIKCKCTVNLSEFGQNICIGQNIFLRSLTVFKVHGLASSERAVVTEDGRVAG